MNNYLTDTSIDELAHNVEKLLEQASPGLPTEQKTQSYIFTSLTRSQRVSHFNLNYLTIAKARELCLIYTRNEGPGCVNKVQDGSRMQKLEEAIQMMSEQLTALSTQKSNSGVNLCFTCANLVTSLKITEPMHDRLNILTAEFEEELISFLGLVNFYQCFVHNFAEIAALLTELTSSKLTFTWTAHY